MISAAGLSGSSGLLSKFPTFKGPGRRLKPRVGERPGSAAAAGDFGAGVLCANCRASITSLRHAIEMHNRFQHNFMNPGGMLYCIGCFAAAPGCRNIGRSIMDHTWFSGFGWRITLCGKCRDHLGWFFESAAGDSFFGLILDKLILNEA